MGYQTARAAKSSWPWPTACPHTLRYLQRSPALPTWDEGNSGASEPDTAKGHSGVLAGPLSLTRALHSLQGRPGSIPAVVPNSIPNGKSSQSLPLQCLPLISDTLSVPGFQRNDTGTHISARCLSYLCFVFDPIIPGGQTQQMVISVPPLLQQKFHLHCVFSFSVHFTGAKMRQIIWLTNKGIKAKVFPITPLSFFKIV